MVVEGRFVPVAGLIQHDSLRQVDSDASDWL